MKTKSVSVYRFASGDCTMNGISAQHAYLQLFESGTTNKEIMDWCFINNVEQSKCIRIYSRDGIHDVAEVVFKRPNSEGTYMAGGNYCDNMNWRLPKLSIHDRFETWELYEQMSK